MGKKKEIYGHELFVITEHRIIKISCKLFLRKHLKMIHFKSPANLM